MHPNRYSLITLFLLILIAFPGLAEEEEMITPDGPTVMEMQQQLIDIEQRYSAQTEQLRQENQELTEQLTALRNQPPPGLLNEQQKWFVVGAATAVVAFVLGGLIGSRRKTRSSWIN